MKALARDLDEEAKVHAQFRANGWPDWAPMPEVWRAPGYSAMLGREHCGGRPSDPLRWHISLRGPGRVPSWNDMVEVAHQLRPGVGFVLSVPPRSLWLNLHPHVLHLWETGDEALMEEWRVNARGHKPT